MVDIINTLYLPELREALAENNIDELREFCTALHPARTAEFMEGLTADETWQVLRHADPSTRAEIFSYIELARQLEIAESQPREEIADLIAEKAADDRVDLLNEMDEAIVDELMPLLPADERRDIQRLRSYPEGTAGSVMTTDVAKLSESLTVQQALDELRHQAEHLETIYYLYIVDADDHLRGLVSARQLVSAMGRPQLTLGELMETDLVTINVNDDQEEMARRVEKFDLMAIPVVDDQHRMLGIVTHDDVFDVVREEAVEDAHRIGAVDPLQESYLETPLVTMSWKRGIWLTVLFVGGFLTVHALGHYEGKFNDWPWLAWFIPLVISSGGNSGSQSATLIITALTAGDVKIRDWLRVMLRELAMGLMLGGFLGSISLFVTWTVSAKIPHLEAALIVPITLVLVVMCGTMIGSLLPLAFKRLGLDPALMSTPFVACLIDILGIVIYMNVALLVLPPGP